MKNSISHQEVHVIFTAQDSAAFSDFYHLCLISSFSAFYLPSLLTVFSHLALAPAFPLLSGYRTSICSVELDAKVPLRSAGVVTGSEDDPTDGFGFPDHTGDGRRGHYPVVSDDQATHLRKCHAGAPVSWQACLCLMGMGGVSSLARLPETNLELLLNNSCTDQWPVQVYF